MRRRSCASSWGSQFPRHPFCTHPVHSTHFCSLPGSSVHLSVKPLQFQFFNLSGVCSSERPSLAGDPAFMLGKSRSCVFPLQIFLSGEREGGKGEEEGEKDGVLVSKGCRNEIP